MSFGFTFQMPWDEAAGVRAKWERREPQRLNVALGDGTAVDGAVYLFSGPLARDDRLVASITIMVDEWAHPGIVNIKSITESLSPIP
jgi:hypothetical protein